MRRFVLVIAVAVILSATLAAPTLAASSPPATPAAPAGPFVVVNGQPLITIGYTAPHIHSDRVFVPVADFAWLVGAEFKWDADTQLLTFNGQAVTYDYSPAPHMHDGHVYAPVAALAPLADSKVTWVADQATVVVAFPGQTPAQKLGLPAGVTRVSGVVPAMGEHWADVRTLPFGPIYGVYNGKMIFWEFMISQADFTTGKNFDGLELLKLQPVDHVDIDFNPNGHEGYDIPHYDIHAYFISKAEQAAIYP